MSTTTEAPSTARVATRCVLDRAALDRAVAAMSTRRRADVEVLESALAWAHAQVPSDDDDVARVALGCDPHARIVCGGDVR